MRTRRTLMCAVSEGSDNEACFPSLAVRLKFQVMCGGCQSVQLVHRRIRIPTDTLGRWDGFSLTIAFFFPFCSWRLNGAAKVNVRLTAVYEYWRKSTDKTISQMIHNMSLCHEKQQQQKIQQRHNTTTTQEAMLLFSSQEWLYILLMINNESIVTLYYMHYLS